MTTYTASYFRSFFQSIDESKWTTHVRDNGKGQYCALGHTCTDESDEAWARTQKWCHWLSLGRRLADTPMTVALHNLVHGHGHWIALVNNGEDKDYQQATPKARVLQALDDIIAKEEAARDAELDRVETRPLVPVDALATV